VTARRFESKNCGPEISIIGESSVDVACTAGEMHGKVLTLNRLHCT